MTQPIYPITPWIGNITPYFQVKDVASLRQTCQEIKNCIDATDAIWQQLFENEGIPTIQGGPSSDFKDTFKLFYPLTFSKRLFEQLFKAKVVGNVPTIYPDVISLMGKMEKPMLVVLPKAFQLDAREDQTLSERMQWNDEIHPENFLDNQAKERLPTYYLTLRSLLDLCSSPLLGHQFLPVFDDPGRRQLRDEDMPLQEHANEEWDPKVFLMAKNVIKTGDNLPEQSVEKLQTPYHPLKLELPLEHPEDRTTHYGIKREEWTTPPLLVRALSNAGQILKSGACPDSENSFTVTHEIYQQGGLGAMLELIRQGLDPREQNNYYQAQYLGNYTPGTGLQIFFSDIRQPYCQAPGDSGIAPCLRVDTQSTKQWYLTKTAPSLDAQEPQPGEFDEDSLDITLSPYGSPFISPEISDAEPELGEFDEDSLDITLSPDGSPFISPETSDSEYE